MKKAELTALLTRIGLQPSRRLGQNFLLDDNLLEAMVRMAAPRPDERVLEVGPGAGMLTSRLLQCGCRLTAVEFDHRLAAWIRSAYGDNPALTLIEADACRVDYEALFGGEPFRCIANLPYSCSSVFLARISQLREPPTELFVLLQKEMADRLAAQPGSKEYGSLTARLALLYRTDILRVVNPRVFFPPPEVQSAYVCLRRRDHLPPLPLRRQTDTLIAAAFAQRRKVAARLMEAVAPREKIAAAYASLGLAPEARAEMLTPNQFLRLAESIQPAADIPPVESSP